MVVEGLEQHVPPFAGAVHEEQPLSMSRNGGRPAQCRGALRPSSASPISVWVRPVRLSREDQASRATGRAHVAGKPGKVAARLSRRVRQHRRGVERSAAPQKPTGMRRQHLRRLSCEPRNRRLGHCRAAGGRCCVASRPPRAVPAPRAAGAGE
jgi:hypothetical protein